MLSAIRCELRAVYALRVLPRPVASFCWRARRHARRCDDRFSLDSAARPAELAELLMLARGRTDVVELGTGTAWSTIALALDDDARTVISYDPCVRPAREAYLDLAGAPVRARVQLRAQPDSDGPRPGDRHVQLLFIDSAHEYEPVLAAFASQARRADRRRARRLPRSRPPRVIPGVRAAVTELALDGHA